MREPASKGDDRQMNCQDRALRARTCARVLMPVALFFAGTSVWKDPVMSAQITDQLIEVRPMAAAYLTGTPLEHMLSLIPVAPESAEPAADTAQSAALPQIEPTVSATVDGT